MSSTYLCAIQCQSRSKAFSDASSTAGNDTDLIVGELCKVGSIGCETYLALYVEQV